jgi:hypothetical protein
MAGLDDREQVAGEDWHAATVVAAGQRAVIKPSTSGPRQAGRRKT